VDREGGGRDLDRVGLCARCMHARRVEAPRAIYWMCRLSLTDARYDKYPRLPVRACDGFEPESREEPH
jgi:hypothetical protein